MMAAGQEEAGNVLVDVRRLYDNFSFKALDRRALELGLQPALVRLCTNVYRGLRLVKLGEAILVAGFAGAVDYQDCLE